MNLDRMNVRNNEDLNSIYRVKICDDYVLRHVENERMDFRQLIVMNSIDDDSRPVNGCSFLPVDLMNVEITHLTLKEDF